MPHLKIMQFREVQDGYAVFVVQTDRKQAATLSLPEREWDLMGQPERLRLAIEPIGRSESSGI